MTTSEAVIKVLGGGKPSRPANALELGLSEKVWKLLEHCWQTERSLRPPVSDVLSRVKAAASVCGRLPSVKSIRERYEEPESRWGKFGRSLPHSSSDVKFIRLFRPIVREYPLL